MLMTAMLWLMACPGLGTGSGGGGVEDPTWVDDVEPLLVEHCATCHTSPAVGGAPSTFRLDRYVDEGDVAGAFSMADRIVARAVDFDPSQMPPGSAPALEASDQQTLVRWVETGAPELAAEEPQE